MEDNFHNKCRACLSENDAMLSLFEVYEHDLTLAMILQSCIATEVSENDGLPSHLCDSCILVLTQFYNFTVVYEESDQKLKKWAKDNKKLIQIDQPGELLENLGEVIEVPDSPESRNSDEVEVSDVLNEIIAVEVSQEEVICASPATMEYYEYRNSNGQERMDNYTTDEYVEPIQELKKELPEEAEVVNGDRNCAELPDMRIKTEIKDENTKYEEITKYECTICGESHLYSSGFQQHMRLKHGMLDINCEEYASRIRIRVHKVDQLGPPSPSLPAENLDKYAVACGTTEKCKYCSKEFFPIQMQHHIKLHEGNRKYVCEVCGARFIRKTYLVDHMEGHSTEKKHVCKFCGKAFRRRTVLRAHKRVHTHPNHYVCEHCGRAFTNSSTLKTHKLLIHMKERNFQCVICSLYFPLKATLNKHVLRHQKRENGEKGFNCTECGMQYRDKSSLKRHVDTKHQGQIQLVGCSDCPKKYTSKANLMKHRRRHHELGL